MKKNTTIWILGFIMLINALSYGIIIPLLYPYASRFGIDARGLAFMFASFSIAQFISTPVLGRLSDRYGRKPLLLICLFGTTAGLALFASATSVFMLFVARIIDGITGGNISVAQAAIADSTEGKERAKAFGMLGAAFGFGFLFGPAIGGLLSQISLTAPFWFAAGIGLIGTLLGVWLLEETLPKNNRQVSSQPLFDFKHMFHALLSPSVGIVLVLSFLTACALNTWILGFQSFTVDILKLSPTNIGLLFATFGLISVIMQAGGIRWLVQVVPHKKHILMGSLVLTSLSLLVLLPITTFLPFFIAVALFGIVSSPVVPMITALISERTKAEDQGGILGVNQSYVSLGQIAGPLLAGAVAPYSVRYVFVLALVIYIASIVAGRWLYLPVKEKVDL